MRKIKKPVPHTPSMPDNGKPRSSEERINELLEANTRLVEEKRLISQKHDDFVKGIVRIMDVMLDTQDDIVAMRMLRELVDGVE